VLLGGSEGKNWGCSIPVNFSSIPAVYFKTVCFSSKEKACCPFVGGWINKGTVYRGLNASLNRKVSSMSERARKRLFDTYRYRLINLYAPFLGAGIRVLHGESDDHTVKVQLKETFYNHNVFGTHFGGSLYAMCDPFFVLIMIHNLGPQYVVWDKSAAIKFIKPGRGTVTVTFHIPPEKIEEICAQADAGVKVEPIFKADITDEKGEIVATVEKNLYIRKISPS
jgi:acyl-coenzyme A thioesterase PaaI-like protein